MKDHSHLMCLGRQWLAGIKPITWVMALTAVLVLGACTRMVVPPTEGPQPTLVATLDLATATIETPVRTAAVTHTASPQPTMIATTPAPLDTPTRTITPWVNDSPTAGPSPTITRTATVTRIPTLTRAPTRTPTITLTPTITFTPTPPQPDLYLVRPGLMSKLISPIQMELYGVTGAGGQLNIELVGEDGRVISRQLIRQGDNEGKRFWLAPALPFEIDAAAETARLQVSSQDAFGRPIALSSVDVLLLSVGRNEINPAAINQESYLIRRPKADEIVSGGTLVLNALARPVNDSPLIIEMMDERGITLTTKQLVVDPPSGELSHTPFTVEIAYRVSEPTPVRLIIRQEGSRIPGSVALISRLIVLAP
jgi:hypothetical protein